MPYIRKTDIGAGDIPFGPDIESAAPMVIASVLGRVFRKVRQVGGKQAEEMAKPLIQGMPEEFLKKAHFSRAIPLINFLAKKGLITEKQAINELSNIASAEFTSALGAPVEGVSAFEFSSPARKRIGLANTTRMPGTIPHEVGHALFEGKPPLPESIEEVTKNLPLITGIESRIGQGKGMIQRIIPQGAIEPTAEEALRAGMDAKITLSNRALDHTVNELRAEATKQFVKNRLGMENVFDMFPESIKSEVKSMFSLLGNK